MAKKLTPEEAVAEYQAALRDVRSAASLCNETYDAHHAAEVAVSKAQVELNKARNALDEALRDG